MSLQKGSSSRVDGEPVATGDVHDDASLVLDTLLERYLNLLDEQQRLQDDLSKRMSTGFLALARANISAAPGRHYGQDYYDQRMKATRRVGISTPKSVFRENPNATDIADNESSAEHSFAIISGSSSGSETTAQDAESSEYDKENQPQNGTIRKKPKRAKPYRSDPLYWFGILVPPALRQAQESFTGVVESPIPRLASVVAEMRQLETRIENSRRQLGLCQ